MNPVLGHAGVPFGSGSFCESTCSSLADRCGATRSVAAMRLRGSGSELTTVEFEWKTNDTKIKKVEVSGSWDNWQTRQELFFTEGEGWSGEMDLPPGRYEYKYVIDERIWVANENEETVVCKLGGQNNVLQVLQVVPSDVLQRLTSIQISASTEQGDIAAVDRTMSDDDLSSARLQ